MITCWPDYYAHFRCLADRCRHTCCAGWEIDVDEAFAARFAGETEVTRHLRDGAIVLGEGERCPFLTESGLCSLILRWGEDALSDICREHPRFYVDHGDHEEAGVGLVCEAACRLVLDWENDFRLTPARPLSREIRLAFDRRRKLSARLNSLSPALCDPMTRTEGYLALEVMDPLWTDLLSALRDAPPTRDEEEKLLDFDTRRFSNFCAYLLYRHPGARRMAVESTRLLADLALAGADLYDAARMFSGEVEYSDINLDALDEFFAKHS